MQLARACAVIANGGLLVKPKLILKEGDQPTPVEPPQRILKPETAITMRQMMEGVVLRGTAKGRRASSPATPPAAKPERRRFSTSRRTITRTSTTPRSWASRR